MKSWKDKDIVCELTVAKNITTPTTPVASKDVVVPDIPNWLKIEGA